MAESVLARVEAPAGIGGAVGVAPAFDISVTDTIEAVEGVWAELLAAQPAESPGQSFGFIRLWADTLGIPQRDRLFATASLDGRPLALLPLMRTRWAGLRIATWFPGTHVGCGAPLADVPRLMAMSPHERRRLWAALTAHLGADLLYLPAVPEAPQWAELGTAVPGDTLYRAAFASWSDADSTQRSKSRRKHDRQQGDKLDALGQVSFEACGPGPAAAPILDVMFRQRAERFVAMGVKDPFAAPAIRAFYNATVESGSGVDVLLHVLRLDGEIVGVRYNVVSANRMFCLISSMSTEPRLQPGSPGKQCLLRVMQTVFDAGTSTFDMGAGLTDEKRHWCNVQVPLRQHYLPLTAAGHIAGAAHRLAQRARHEIKTNPKLLGIAKQVRGTFVRGKAPAPDAAE